MCFSRYISILANLLREKVVLLLFIAGVTFTLAPIPSVILAKPLHKDIYTSELDSYLQSQMENYKIPGVAVAIVHDSEVEYIKGFGVANTNGDFVTPDTPFLLASVSKSITAVGVMQLVEAGKISLDDPVQKFLPWFSTADGGGEEINVSDLLYHTSGFSELAGHEMILWSDTYDALEAGVRELENEKLAFKPGTNWEYSNLNYDVLGLLIQEVSGQRYQTYITENIFIPLGMEHSYTSMSKARAGNAASGYYPFFGIPVVYDDYMPYSPATLPAAGLWSSASDMSHYLIAQLNDGQYGTTTLLSPASLEEIQQPGIEIEAGYNYAMGWFHAPSFLDREFLQTLNTDLNQYDDLDVLWHEGDWPNYKSVALMLPDLDFGVILLMNSNDPAILSVFRYFAWDVALIANGGEAVHFPPSEGFIVRYSRWIFSGIALILISGLVWSSFILRKRSENISSPIVNQIQIWLPVILNIGLLAYLYLVLLPENALNVPTLLYLVPDIGILTMLISFLSIAWIGLSLFRFVKLRKVVCVEIVL